MRCPKERGQKWKEYPKSENCLGTIKIRSLCFNSHINKVKDSRSGQTFTNVDAILDGDIDKLLEGVLISQVESKNRNS